MSYPIIIEKFDKTRNGGWTNPKSSDETMVFTRDDGTPDTLTNNELRQIIDAYKKKWRI